MSEKWNDGQLNVINNTSGNMIVSASAGSGKTATMIERVKRLVIDKKVPVSRILMLSFNEAIASEIKVKMAKTLINEVKTSPDKDFLREQIDSLGMADIVTLHSFCNSLIKEYFDVVGIDPSYAVMDEKEADVIVNKSINEVFEEYFDAKDTDFILLNDKLGGNDSENLRAIVRRVFEFSDSLLDSDEWLDNAINANYNTPLEKTKPVRYLVQEIHSRLKDAIDKVSEAIMVLGVQDYPELSGMLEHLTKYESDESILKYQDFIKYSVELPSRRFSKDDPNRDIFYNAKDTYKSVIDFVTKLYPVPFSKMREDHETDSLVVKKLVEVVKRFKTLYNREKAEVNKIDYSDMEHYAVEILRHDEIAADVRSKYDYVCVDEYQDTNEVQNMVLSTVSNGGNLFMVGDPKQSIYRFRFTEPEIFVDKLNRYADSETDHVVELDKNYRSSPLILKNINYVFDNLMIRPDAGMVSSAYSSLDNGLDFVDNIETPFEVMLYTKSREEKEVVDTPSTYRVSLEEGKKASRSSSRIEADYLAKKINYLLKQEIYDVKEGGYRRIEPSDMAILSEKRGDAVKEVLDILENEYKLPVDSTYLKRKEETQEVNILLDLLRCIDNPRQDIPLYTVMKMFFDFTDDDFVSMKRYAAKTDFFYEVLLSGKISDERLKGRIDAFIDKFEEYRFMSTFMNVYDFLLCIVDVTDFKRKLLMSPSGKMAIDNIDKFIASLKGVKHASTIQEFLYAYDNYDIKNDIDSTSETINNAIHTSTIHGSKGLEYPIVFIINAGSGFGSSMNSRASYLLDKELGFAMRTFNEKNKSVYSNWLLRGILDKTNAEEKQEELRLLYVAMTRAKNCLYIVGSVSSKEPSFDGINKFSDWLRYIAKKNANFSKNVIISNDKELLESRVEADIDDARAFDYEPYTDADKREYEAVFDFEYPFEESTHLAQKYTVTSINHEEREQEEYVPELYETERTSVGSIYHKFMENVNYEANTIDGIKSELQRMVDEKILTDEEISCILIDDVYKCLNSDIIKKAKANRHEREKKFMMNVPLSEVKPGASDEKVIIQGIADLVIYGKENILVDFKKSTLPPNMLKDSYRRQLEIYNYALSESMGIHFDKMYLYVIGQDKTIEL